jgi:hypothetical protein
LVFTIAIILEYIFICSKGKLIFASLALDGRMQYRLARMEGRYEPGWGGGGEGGGQGAVMGIRTTHE